MRTIDWKQIISLLVIATFALGQQQLKCTKYICKAFISEKHEFCYQQKDSDVTLVRKCDGSDSYCTLPLRQLFVQKPEELGKEYTCQATLKRESFASSYPGDVCTQDKDCRSEGCDSNLGICIGLKEGGACDETKNIFCQQGLVCSATKLCAKPAAVGSQCAQTSDCSNDAFCNAQKVCQMYMTVAKGGKITDKVAENGFNLECETLYADKNSVCQDAPASKRANMTAPCKSDQECALSDGTFGSCRCGFNDKGDAYCQPSVGDPVYQKIKEVATTLISTNKDCHTYSRFSQLCPSIKSKASLLDNLITYGSNYPFFQNVPSCLADYVWSLVPNRLVIEAMLENKSNEQPKETPKTPGTPEPAKQEPPKQEPAKQEPAKPEPPKQEPAKQEPPKQEPPKQEPPKQEPPKQEPPKQEPSKQEPPKQEPAKPEPPKQEPPKQEPSKQEPPKQEPAKQEPPKQEPAKQEPPKQEPIKEEPKGEENKKPFVIQVQDKPRNDYLIIIAVIAVAVSIIILVYLFAINCLRRSTSQPSAKKQRRVEIAEEEESSDEEEPTETEFDLREVKAKFESKKQDDKYSRQKELDDE